MVVGLIGVDFSSRLKFVVKWIILWILQHQLPINPTIRSFVQAFHLLNILLRQSKVEHIKVVNDPALGDTLGNGDDTFLKLSNQTK